MNNEAVIDSMIFEHGTGTVQVNVDGTYQLTGIDSIDRIDLFRYMAIAFKSLLGNYAGSDLKSVEGFPIDGDINNLSLDNVGYRFKGHVVVKGVVIRNARTGEVLSFHTQQSAAAYLGVSPKAIAYRLDKGKSSTVWADGYQVKRADDFSAFEEYSLEAVESLAIESGKSKGTGALIKNCLTGAIVEVASVNAAGEVMGFSSRKAHYMLENGLGEAFRGFQIIPNDGISNFKPLSFAEVMSSFDCFTAVNLSTLEVIVGKNATEVALATGIGPRGEVVQRAVSNGGYYKGYRLLRGDYKQLFALRDDIMRLYGVAITYPPQ